MVGEEIEEEGEEVTEQMMEEEPVEEEENTESESNTSKEGSGGKRNLHYMVNLTSNHIHLMAWTRQVKNIQML